MVSQVQKVRMDGQAVCLSYMAAAFSSRSGGRRQQNGDAESAVTWAGGFVRGRGMRCGKLCRGLAVVDVDKETRCSGQEKHAGRVRFMEGWGRKEWRRVEGCGRQYRDRGILRSRDSVRAVWTASV